MRYTMLLKLFFGLGFLSAFSQQTKYRIDWEFTVPNEYCKCKNAGIISVELISDLGNSITIQDEIWGMFGRTIKGTTDMVLNQSFEVFISTKSDIRGQKTDCFSTLDMYVSKKSRICESTELRPDYKFGKGHITGATCFKILFDVKNIVPIIEIEGGLYGAEIGYNDVIKKSAQPGFDFEGYIWEYTTVSNRGDANANSNWKTLSNRPFIYQQEIDFLVSSFIDEKDIGKYLVFRIRSCSNYNPYDIDEYAYHRILHSAPKFLEVAETDKEKPKCHGDKNGAVTLRFDRDLRDTERISISIVDLVTNVPIEIGDAYDFLSKDDITDRNIRVSGIPAGNYRAEVLSVGSFSEGNMHDVLFSLEDPVVFEFNGEPTAQNVSCFRGTDGSLSFNGQGGSRYYFYRLDRNGTSFRDWTEFSSRGLETVSDLPEGDYTIYIKDANDCTTEPKSITIAGPEAPLSYSHDPQTDLVEPLAFGASNGSIWVGVQDGTPLANGSYDLEWRNSSGQILTTISSQITGNAYRERLYDVPAGTYSVTIRDANGCSLGPISFTLTQPPKLELEVTQTQQLSCNAQNEPEALSGNAELVATATGGLPLANSENFGLPYFYVWERKNDQGQWEAIPEETDHVLDSRFKRVDARPYRVNIIDAHGISLPEPVEFEITEPMAISINQVSIQNAQCFNGSDGFISISVSGGTGNHQIQWDHGATGNQVTGLSSGNYRVLVTDDNGCYSSRNFTITQPNAALGIVNTDFKRPSVIGGQDGWFTVEVAGGTPLANGYYNITWQNTNGTLVNADTSQTVLPNGNVRLRLANIGVGNYSYSITDANYENAIEKSNCAILDGAFDLFDPLEVEFEVLKEISCNGTNDTGDPFADGILLAKVRGGARQLNGMPYTYQWKRETDSGQIEAISVNDSILQNIDGRTYYLNVIDAQGFVFGRYESSQLIESVEREYTMEEPPLLDIAFEKQNVYCYQGADGWAHMRPIGGQSPYTIQWENGETSERISNLSAGAYTVTLTDGAGCKAVRTIQIEQPETFIQIDYVNFQRPSVPGVNDGWIEAVIQGGTPSADGSYDFDWSQALGTNLNNQVSTQVLSNGNGYRLRLQNIGAGTYSLDIRDGNYSLADTNSGCALLQNQFTLYDPLSVIFEQTEEISCNKNNTYGDPFADGKLIAHVTGGLQHNSGMPYTYQWKRRADNGAWENIAQANDSIITNLDARTYALNVVDAQGFVLGEYLGNVLQREVDAEYEMVEPPLVTLDFITQDALCYGGSDGWAEAVPEGGIGPYTIEWEDGSTDFRLENLAVGTYRATITDAKGCHVQAQASIGQPENPLQIEYIDYQRPTNGNTTDGWIKALISGGTPAENGSYDFVWRDTQGNDLVAKVVPSVVSNGYELTLTDLGAGQYFLDISDAQFQSASTASGCEIRNDSFTLYEPITVDFELLQAVSCNKANEFGDPWSDGVLLAKVRGGARFESGNPYRFLWKKRNDSGGWEALSQHTDSIASNLDARDYALNVLDAQGHMLGEYSGSVLQREIDSVYTLTEPPLLELGFNKQDVFCYQGSDGWAEIVPFGGVPPYTVQWDQGSTENRIENLEAGLYVATITDAIGCHARVTVPIEAPRDPITINYTAFGRPSSLGAADGWLEAEIQGGTPFSDGSYGFGWENISGQILSNTTVVNTSPFRIRINGLSKGTYYLTVTDAHFNSASTKGGCTQIKDAYTLYDPIQAAIKVLRTISCNPDNEFLDPSNDGALEVEVAGGLPFEQGQPYHYYWKKLDQNGNYVPIGDNAPLLEGLSSGLYVLNVQDARGEWIGIYESDRLIMAQDVTYNLVDPDLAQLQMEGTQINCEGAETGAVKVTPIGGTGNFSYRWSNGMTGAEINNVPAGKYFVYVTDEKGCEVIGQYTLTEPTGLKIQQEMVVPPLCAGGNEGEIHLSISGGATPYSVSWTDGSNLLERVGLTAGAYTITVTDALGCSKEEMITLADPLADFVDLGPDQTLCKGQSLTIDGSYTVDTGASYLWTADNGFSSDQAFVEITQPGTYTLSVLTTNGCSASDTLVVSETETAVEARFLVSTQALAQQEVALVNLSVPLGDTTEWLIPEGVALLAESNENAIVIFEAPGYYDLGLRSTIGACSTESFKRILIGEAAPDFGDEDEYQGFIQTFTVYPNPSDGKFTVDLGFLEVVDASLKLFNIGSKNLVTSKKVVGSDRYKVDFNLQLATGSYLLLLETPKGSEIRKVLIQ